MSFKPLLASPVDFKHLDYGNTWLSPKLDGIRAIIMNRVVLSRSLKPIPNAFIQDRFGRPEFEHFDGELIVGDPTDKNCYQATNSGVMSKKGEPDAQFYAFDHIAEPTRPYFARYKRLSQGPHMMMLQQHGLQSYTDVLELEAMYLGQGYEGVMLREFDGPRSFYKYGRSTPKECTLLKLKRFADGEAIVIGVEEEMANHNKAITNAVGRTERSSHAENKVGKGRLGALVCKTADGIEFRIGTGFTAAQRQAYWDDQECLIGSFTKYKSFQIGVKDAPRFPVFLGWRDRIDM